MRNKNSKLKLLSALMMFFYTTGCSTQKLSNEDMNTAVGASIGGVLGSVVSNDNIIMTLLGTGIGAYIGNNFGKDMDHNEKEE